MSQDFTLDDFLGGKVRAYQPRKGYRAGVDPVLLAGSVPAKSGQSVLELGCGVGVASLCLGHRIPRLQITGLELQETYADLARKNAALNASSFEVVSGDLSAMPMTLKEQSFDHVLANPPYFKRDRSTEASDQGRETALGEDTPLGDWVKAAAKRLKPNGTATFIHRAERLPDLIVAMAARLGSLQILPLVPRKGRDVRLVIVRARKGGKSPMRLHDSLVMHVGAAHERDEDDYSPEIQGCLRDGLALPFPE